MRCDFAKSSLLAIGLAAFAAGCGRPPASSVVVPSTEESVSASELHEPAHFAKPTDVALRPIEDSGAKGLAGLRFASMESPQEENDGAPQPLPIQLVRTTQDDGDFAAVEDRARQLIEQAYKLADRGAIYSARSDLLTAMQMLCEGADAVHGVRRCSKAFEEALTAMEEAADFVVTGDARIDLAKVIAGHQTSVLKKAKRDELTCILAMQSYYNFAERKLIEAGNCSPAASEALCGLGKIVRSLPTNDSADRRNARVKSLVFQRSAIAIWEKNHHARNELGVLYAQLGRPQDAKEHLLEVAEATNWPTAWANLSRVHAMLDEMELSDLAMAEAKRARGASINKATEKGPFEIQWVTPDHFIAEGPDDAPPAAMAKRPTTSAPRSR